VTKKGIPKKISESFSTILVGFYGIMLLFYLFGVCQYCIIIGHCEIARHAGNAALGGHRKSPIKMEVLWKTMALVMTRE
jgi:hypothetical protein